MYNVTMKRVRATIVAVENQSVIYYKRVFVAFNTQRQMRMPHTVICCLSGYTVFFYIISNTAWR
jgi:hypothetical protein